MGGLCNTIFQAAQEGYAEVYIVLLEHNANIKENLKDDWTQLFKTAQRCHAELHTVLLEHNTNGNEKWEDG